MFAAIMIARDLISEHIIPLKTSDTGLEALSMMEEYRVSHLPIVNNVDFLGLISESDILNYNELEMPLGNHGLSLQKPYVTEKQHIFDVLRIVADLDLTLIPVLGQRNQYLGVITLPKLVKHFARWVALQNPGGIIVLELNSNDYSLTEIAGIVESNDAKILSLFTTSQPDSTVLNITLKLNKRDIRGVLQTFNRYNYVVKESYVEEDYYEDLLRRYDEFINYLNI